MTHVSSACLVRPSIMFLFCNKIMGGRDTPRHDGKGRPTFADQSEMEPVGTVNFNGGCYNIMASGPAVAREQVSMRA